MLTSLNALNNARLTPDSMRAIVRRRKAEGVDVIKVFASGSIRDGGRMNVTQEQLDALCGEARTLGIRTAVHAHSPDSILAAVYVLLLVLFPLPLPLFAALGLSAMFARSGRRPPAPPAPRNDN